MRIRRRRIRSFKARAPELDPHCARPSEATQKRNLACPHLDSAGRSANVGRCCSASFLPTSYSDSQQVWEFPSQRSFSLKLRLEVVAHRLRADPIRTALNGRAIIGWNEHGAVLTAATAGAGAVVGLGLRGLIGHLGGISSPCDPIACNRSAASARGSLPSAGRSGRILKLPGEPASCGRCGIGPSDGRSIGVARLDVTDGLGP